MTHDPEPNPSDEHPWVTKMRHKFRQRGFAGDRLDAEMERIFTRLPQLRPKRNPNEGLYRAIKHPTARS